MKRLLFIPLCALFFSATAQNIIDAYLSMPDECCLTLSAKQRNEMLEYAKVGRTDSLLNRFGHWSNMVELDTVRQCIRLALTPKAEFDMAMFEHNGAHYIATIETVCAPVCSSIIALYTEKWDLLNRVPASAKAATFLHFDSNTDSNLKDKVEQLLPAVFVQAVFAPDENGSFVLSNQTIATLDAPDAAQCQPFLQTIRQKWTDYLPATK